MREIKFRGQRVDTKKWVYGYYSVLHDDCGNEHHYIRELPKCVRNLTVFGYGKYDFDDNYGELYEVIPETVGEFTGLTDKNGKEIYEGDIVQGYSAYYCYLIDYIGFGFKWKAILNEEGKNLSCADKMPTYEFEEIIDSEESFNTHHEIVGNIHEKGETK